LKSSQANKNNGERLTINERTDTSDATYIEIK